ncbi:hypothetical protein ABEB36_009058 [Hypothenemus hampei]|uniref:Uncharacterized protein n=1 Tax=Hypothenemus hampei TaxID=57062 RepID=A0ABD1ERY7_HYPHA
MAANSLGVAFCSYSLYCLTTSVLPTLTNLHVVFAAIIKTILVISKAAAATLTILLVLDIGDINIDILFLG